MSAPASKVGAYTPLELFEGASNLPPDERAAYLDARCGNDAALRAEVQSLLDHHDHAGEFLEHSPFAVEPISDSATLGEMVSALAGVLPPGVMVGTYRIERVLGEGGMGVVYLAHQLNPARPVALKVIRAGAAGSTTLRRFQREAQLLGRLQHPGIAQIFEAGTAQIVGGIQQPFLAMELVEGKSLTDFAHAANLDLRARLDLLAKVCDAVDHAHRRGLVHRDLKPGNILVTPAGEPKVLDFGVARAVDADATLATEQGQLLGTLAYMSPEQISGGGAAADTRSDVYALGVILYQLLTGRTPHEIHDKTVIDGARFIRETDPPRPSQITRTLRGDVETIILMALAKEPERRYQTAASLAEDIRRFLAGIPIEARHDSALYVLQKSVRRYRWSLAAGIIFVAIISAWSIWAGINARAYRLLAQKESAANAAAQASEHEARELLRAGNIERGRLLAVNGDMHSAEDTLWNAMAQRPGEKDAYWALCEMYSRFPVIGRVGLGERVHWVRFNQSGSRLAVAGFEGAIALIDVHSGDMLWKRSAAKGRINSICFNPDESMLATAGLDGVIRFWNPADGSPLGELPAHKGADAEAQFTLDGTQIISGCVDGAIRTWDVASRRLLRELPATGRPLAALRLSPDGKSILVGDTSGAVELLDFATGSQLWQSPIHTAYVLSLAFSPSGQSIVSSGNDTTVALVDPATGSVIKRISAPGRNARAVEFSPDGAKIIITGTWSTVLLDASTLELVQPGMPELLGGWHAEYSQDAKVLATTAAPDSILLWSATGNPACTTRLIDPKGAFCLAASPDGLTIAAGCNSGVIALLSSDGSKELRRMQAPSMVLWLAYSPDGSTLAAACQDGSVRLYDPSTGSLIRTLTAGRNLLAAVDFFPGSKADGERLIAGGRDGQIYIWNVATGEPITHAIPPQDNEVLGIAFSPDKELLAIAYRGHDLHLLSAATLAPLSVLVSGTANFNPTFSPDSKLLAVGNFSASTYMWNVATGELLPALTSHTRFMPRPAFSPDSSLLATAAMDGLFKLWDTRNSKCLATFKGSGADALNTVWIPASQRVAIAYRSGEVEVWNLDALVHSMRANTQFNIDRLLHDPTHEADGHRLQDWANHLPPL